MTRTNRLASICFFVFSMTIVAAAQGRNSIQGRVLGANGRGIEDARVLLKNRNQTDVAQDITDSMGNYRFTSLTDGVYYIEVLPLGTGYDGKTLRVELAGLSTRQGGSAEIYHFDFELRPLIPAEKPLPKKLADALAFAQEIPPTALQKYKDAHKRLEKDKKDEAYALLRDAIEIFPDYFDALEMLGIEYLKAGYFDVAVPIFLQAVDVNPKGWRSYYGLGSAYSSLSLRKKAVAALRKSMDLNPMYTKSYLSLGAELAKDKETLDEAITIYQKVIKLEPVEASEPYIALASIYSSLGRYAEAADALETYLKVATDLKNSGAIREKIRALRKKAPVS